MNDTTIGEAVLVKQDEDPLRSCSVSLGNLAYGFGIGILSGVLSLNLLRARYHFLRIVNHYLTEEVRLTSIELEHN